MQGRGPAIQFCTTKIFQVDSLTRKFPALEKEVLHGLNFSTTAEAGFRCSYSIEKRF